MFEPACLSYYLGLTSGSANQRQRQRQILDIHIPSFRVVLLPELAGISRLSFAGESSSEGAPAEALLES